MGTAVFRKKSLMLHLGIAITVFITIIELILFVGSYRSQRDGLLQLRSDLRMETLKASGKDFHDLHPVILSDADIKNRLSEYSKNILQLVLLIIFFVVLCTSAIYYFFAGRHLSQLRRLINFSTEKHFLFYPTSEIPSNDIGEIILDRNNLLRKVESYQNNLEKRLDESRQQLVHSAKLSAVGESTASIAHDLKNPLAVIMGNLELLKKKINKDEPEKSLGRVDKIMFAAERIHRLVERMNKFSQNNFSLSEKVDLLQLIKNSIILIESKVDQYQVEINVDVADTLDGFNADAGALEQVFMNLISNSIDAMELSETRRIDISARETDGQVEISIKDSGSGVPKELQEKIFGSFFTSKNSEKGTGLGLGICTQIIELHGGSIKLNGDYKNGAEFIVTLPIEMAVLSAA